MNASQLAALMGQSISTTTNINNVKIHPAVAIAIAGLIVYGGYCLYQDHLKGIIWVVFSLQANFPNESRYWGGTHDVSYKKHHVL